MEDYLYKKDLWRSLEGIVKKGTMTDEDWNILDRKELETIWLCMEPSMTFNITEAKTIDQLMKALTKLFEKTLNLK